MSYMKLYIKELGLIKMQYNQTSRILNGGDMNEEALIQQIVANFKKLNEEDKLYVLDSLKFIQDNPNLVVLKNEDSQ